MAPASVSRACRIAWNTSPVNLVVATFCVNKAIQAVSFFGWWWFVVHSTRHDDESSSRIWAPAVGLADDDLESIGGQERSDQDVFPLLTASSSSSHSFALPLTPLQLVIGAQLVIIGQTLNVAVYRAIGRDGVYYGGGGDEL